MTKNDFELVLSSDSPDWPPTIKTTPLPGVLIIERPAFPDERGSFQELFRIPELEKVLGSPIDIQQANKSVNKPKVIRGLHAAPWGKLVHCYYGEAVQVVVDLREESPTFGRVFTAELSQENPVTVWVPPGCANGFCVPGKDGAVYGYAVTSIYQTGLEIGLRWNDPHVLNQFKWPVVNPLVSEKDRQNPGLKELFPKKDFSPYPWLLLKK